MNYQREDINTLINNEDPTHKGEMSSGPMHKFGCNPDQKEIIHTLHSEMETTRVARELKQISRN